MDIFIGEYQHSVDEKGRVAIPAKFRVRLESGGIITRGTERYLAIYTLEDWQLMDQKLETSSLTTKQRQEIERRFYGPSSELELDKQGRIVIPAPLRQYAEIGNEVMILGARRRLEIWDAKVWESYQAHLETVDLSGIEIPF